MRCGFTLKRCTDSQGRQDNRTLTLRIWPPPPLTVSTSSLRPAIVDQPYTATLRAIGGNPPYTWQVTGLPAPLTADSTGIITGTPTATGRYPIVVTVTDEDGDESSDEIRLRGRLDDSQRRTHLHLYEWGSEQR